MRSIAELLLNAGHRPRRLVILLSSWVHVRIYCPLQGRNNWVNLGKKPRVWLGVWLGIQCHELSRMTQRCLIIAGIDVICNQKSSHSTRMSPRASESRSLLQQLNCPRMTGCLVGYDWRMTVLYPRTVLQIKLSRRRIERTTRQGWQIDICHGLKSC